MSLPRRDRPNASKTPCRSRQGCIAEAPAQLPALPHQVPTRRPVEPNRRRRHLDIRALFPSNQSEPDATTTPPWLTQTEDDLTNSEQPPQEKTFCSKEKKSLVYVIAIMKIILHGIDARTSFTPIRRPRASTIFSRRTASMWGRLLRDQDISIQTMR